MQRREFLKSSAASGLRLLASETGVLTWLQAQQSANFRPNAYIQIGPSNQIEFWLTRCEMG